MVGLLQEMYKNWFLPLALCIVVILFKKAWRTPILLLLLNVFLHHGVVFFEFVRKQNAFAIDVQLQVVLAGVACR